MIFAASSGAYLQQNVDFATLDGGVVALGIGVVPLGIGVVPLGLGAVPLGIGVVPLGLGAVPLGVAVGVVLVGVVPASVGGFFTGRGPWTGPASNFWTRAADEAVVVLRTAVALLEAESPHPGHITMPRPSTAPTTIELPRSTLAPPGKGKGLVAGCVGLGASRVTVDPVGCAAVGAGWKREAGAGA